PHPLRKASATGRSGVLLGGPGAGDDSPLSATGRRVRRMHCLQIHPSAELAAARKQTPDVNLLGI
ncbi:hypothetical protein WA026_008345, partial [Henosepilachna vigintioctopunctata]